MWFWLRACSTHTPDFLTLPIECKCRTMVEWSQFITFTNSQVRRRGSLWINVFNRSSSNPEGLPEHETSLMSKWSFLKWEPFSFHALSDGIVPIHDKCFWTLSPLYLISKKRICQKCSNFSTWHSIFYHPWLHSLSSNDKTSICKLKYKQLNFK